MLSKGFDGNVGYHEKIGNVNLTVRGNITYSKNEIKETDEAYTNFPYLRQAGFRVEQAKGLVALGLFKDYEEIRNSPKQQFDDSSKVMPGDIRYKDVNGDGVINDNGKGWISTYISREPASHPSSLTDSQYTHSQVVTGEMY